MRTTAMRKSPRVTQTQLGLFVGANAPELRPQPRRHINREEIEIQLGIVAAETWPARYKFHKYWGRKPANVVGQYVEFFSDPGDTVLDPFAGSGVTVIESARLQRRAIGFDLNPVAAKMTAAMLAPPSPQDFELAARRVSEQAFRTCGQLFVTTCDSCGGDATLRSVGYIGAEAREVRYRCEACRRSATHSPIARDLELAERQVSAPDDTPDDKILFGWEMQKLKRRGVQRWRDLFTSRNFAAAGELRKAILQEEDRPSRDWLMLTLTASLAQFTKMIADFSGDAGGPSWKINCYWMPDKWQELNPLWYFENRVSKSLDSIRDLISAGAPFSMGSVDTTDSRRMPLADASVDYIFTDPPYGGEGIQYGELSLLWGLWLGEREALDAEVAFNPYRKLDQGHYASGLARVFAECFRVLKPGRWMTVTFANKDPVVWDSLMKACRGTGFSLVTAAPMKRSAPSLTETTMHTAPKADLVLSFLKPENPKADQPQHDPIMNYSVDAAVLRMATAMQRDGVPVIPHDVFDRVTVDWFSWFYENGERPDAVQPTLARVESVLRQAGIQTQVNEVAPDTKKGTTKTAKRRRVDKSATDYLLPK